MTMTTDNTHNNQIVHGGGRMKTGSVAKIEVCADSNRIRIFTVAFL